MILNYLKKIFSKICQNFNDFKLFKKNFQKYAKILMILNYLKKIFSKICQNFNDFKLFKKIFSKIC